MSVPAARELRFFWPWIRIQQIVAQRVNALFQHQSPDIDQISAQQQVIAWHLPCPAQIASEPVCRLIDADDEAVRMMLRKLTGRQTHAAPGVDDQRLFTRSVPRRDGGLECLPVMEGNRTLIPRVRMTLCQRMQLIVNTGLIAADRAGIGVQSDRLDQ